MDERITQHLGLALASELTHMGLAKLLEAALPEGYSASPGPNARTLIVTPPAGEAKHLDLVTGSVRRPWSSTPFSSQSTDAIRAAFTQVFGGVR